MKKSTKITILIILLLIILAVLIFFIIKTTKKETANDNSTTTTPVSYSSVDNLHINMASWNYDSENNVYWQIGLVYCSKPVAKDYESMGIYVPGKYFNGIKNSDGTYSCSLNTTEKIGNYTSKTAPIVLPVNTGGYAAQAAPTSYNYSGISDYLNAGFIYVYSGCRGKTNGSNYEGNAPTGVTDLKSAIRYLRYNSSSLPGNTENIFTFGHSGGGAQSALVGATGDSSMYTPYLEKIGAIINDDSGNYISDAIAGSMCWCPITSLDVADEAYEWNMGQYFSTDTRADTIWTSALSDDLADSFASYINNLKLKDNSGNTLILEKSNSGIYTSGSYYNYLLSVIETSLNNFLKDTTFPYTPSNNMMVDGGFGGGNGGFPGGMKPGNMTEMPRGNFAGGMNGGQMPSNSSTSSTTYQTVQEYINSLNSDEKWINYDSSTNTAKISSIESFVKHCKNASKSVGAFDNLERTQAENDLFGNATTDALHFDSIMAQLLKNNQSKYSVLSGYDSKYVTEYESDLTNVDSLGNSSIYRQNMYNPMYYISNYYAGYNTSKLAKYWRIRTGINQGDTALTTETNLALALKSNSTVSNVDFETVWGQAHTTAERTGTSSANLISWINDCISSK